MNDDLPQLRFALQALALPIIGQVRLAPDDCTRIGLLVEAFNAAYPPIHAESGTPLTVAQAAALTRLEAQLAQVYGQATPSACSELALRQSHAWRQVRLMARESLVQFQWPLEVPPLAC